MQGCTLACLHPHGNCKPCIVRARKPLLLVLAQFPYTEAVVKEALRLYPPATMTSRKVPDTPGGVELGPNLHLKPGQVGHRLLYVVCMGVVCMLW